MVCCEMLIVFKKNHISLKGIDYSKNKEEELTNEDGRWLPLSTMIF